MTYKDKHKLKRKLLSTGKFVTVQFTKKDGTERTLNGRGGVTRYLKGGKNTVQRNNSLTLYEPKSKGYRNVNLDTITLIKAEGQTYE